MHAIIGGHVAAMETSMETLKREFEEELHAKTEVDNLLAIGEIYFPWGKRPCHQICLYYNVRLVDDSIPLDGVFHGYDDSDGGTGMLADRIYQFWLELLVKVTPEDKKKMFDWFTAHLDGSIIDYLEEYIEQYVCDEMSKNGHFR